MSSVSCPIGARSSIRRRQRISNFFSDERAPTATEYAVMLALILLVVIVAVALLGERVSSLFEGARNF